MPAKTASVIARIDSVTGDTARKRFSLPAIARWMDEAQGIICELQPRAAAEHRVFTLVEGPSQDLRNEPSVAWIRVHEAVCNTTAAGEPTGPAIRMVEGNVLGRVRRDWRNFAPATQVDEVSLDERDPFVFTVFPPAAAGTKVQLLATVRPGPVCVLNSGGTALLDPEERVGVRDGFDTPLVDWVLFRLFSKDSEDQSYQARAKGHFDAAQLVLGLALRDAA